MGKFKLNDIVVCIDDSLQRKDLTKERFYKVLGNDFDTYQDIRNIKIVDDSGIISWFSSERFESIDVRRNDIINGILS